MGDRLLATIIELEKTLQTEVSAEAGRAAAWSERELAALAHTVTTVRQQLDARLAGEMAAARQAAIEDGERLLAAAQSRCVRLAALPDSLKEEIVRGLMDSLLPENGNDHPHGQGGTGRSER